MPDANKHAALAAQGFRIPPNCGTCAHWSPTSASWGTCALATYQHGKHTGERNAGTPESGTCNEHSLDPQSLCIAVGEDYASRYSPDEPFDDQRHSYVLVAVRVSGGVEESLGKDWSGNGILPWLGAAFPSKDVTLLNTIPAPPPGGDVL